MCGVAGGRALLGVPDAEGVRRAARALAHRGPDADGFFVEGAAALGHRRLSILDLETGGQPMTREGVTLVFNGGACGFVALRDEMMGRGHPVTTPRGIALCLRSYL